MKHLSRQYKPAEKEFLKLADTFMNVFRTEEAAGTKLHGDVYKFVEILTDMIGKVEELVGTRIERQEKKEREEAEERANAQGNCPTCKENRPAVIFGEVKLSQSGYTHNMMRCKVCKTEYPYFLPKDDKEALAFMKKFTTQMRTVQDDGRALWEVVGVPEEQIVAMEEKYEVWKEACRVELETIAQQDAAEAALHEIIEKMRDDLLLIRLRQLNWNKDDKPNA